MGGDEEKKDKKGDTRVPWMLRRISILQNVRPEKFDKYQQAFMQDMASLQALQRFLSEKECPYIFFHPVSAESTSANSTDFPTPSQIKKKVIVVHRAKPECDIVAATIAADTVILELSKNVMDMLHAYCHSVYLSTLMNPSNQRGWSDLISKDLMDKYHVFLANLHVTAGLMKGLTWLPHPPRDALPSGGGGALMAGTQNNPMNSIGNKDRVHVLEGAVITWTKQIRHVLKQDPEMLLKAGNNPQPLAELDFWENKQKNLNSIHSQLGQDGLKKVLKFLENSKSTYTAPFSRVQKEVEEAREEAMVNHKFLQTMKDRIEKMDKAEFETLDTLFDGILHNILLIWRYSKFYNTPTRLAVLIREICNTIIHKATEFINGPEIFNLITSDEAAACFEKLDKTFKICTAFKSTYVLYKDVAAAQGGDGWKMKNDALFVRLDAFRDRCKDALDFTDVVRKYEKLTRVDLGGTKGKLLTICKAAIQQEFDEAVETFKKVTYDIMDVSEKQFDVDFLIFRQTVKDLDRRLGSLLAEAFDDLDTIDARLKLFDNFEGLIERSIIQAELEKKHKVVLKNYRQDLTDVECIFEANEDKVSNGYDDAPIFCNLPPVAGAIYWARCLRRRITEPMPKIMTYNQALKSVPEEFGEVKKTYEALDKKLKEFEDARYRDWEGEVEAAKEKLRLRLLRRREKTGLLRVNFDPALTRLLREVRFFLVFDIEVPDSAQEVYAMIDTYRAWEGQLQQIVGMYNAVLTELLPVEEPLLEEKIANMDQALYPGLTDLKWKSVPQIPEFIEKTMKIVSEVSDIVNVLKSNLRKISGILNEWCKELLITRTKQMKPKSIEDFDLGHKDRVGTRMSIMNEGGKEIHKFVKESSEALKVSKVSPVWKSYVDFVNNVVIEGFVSSIAVSLQMLCEILDPLLIFKNEWSPIFDVKLELQGSDIIFDPPFHSTKSGVISLRMVIDGWLKDFFATVTCMPRLDMNSGDYLSEIREHFQMQCLLALVSELVDATECKCMEFKDTFMRHSYLWTCDIDVEFDKWLKEDARDLVEGYTHENGSTFRDVMEKVKVDIGPPIPHPSKFDEKILYFETMKHDLSQMKTPKDIHWLRIDVYPVKVALVAFAKQWEQKHADFFRIHTEERITAVVSYINGLKDSLNSEGLKDAGNQNERLLYQTMTDVSNVQLSKEAIEKMMPPLREYCALLKKHHIQHEGLDTLELAPSRWKEVNDTTWRVQADLADTKEREVLTIRTKTEKFAESVNAFREEFCKACPFTEANAEACDFDLSYDTLDEYNEKVNKVREDAKEFNQLEFLFGLHQSEYRALKQCSDDLILLKNIWDGVVLANETFTGWNSILWADIDTDSIAAVGGKLREQVKKMPKGVRSWPLYQWLMSKVKNMGTVLPLLDDLHQPTMRNRHWLDLEARTGKSIDHKSPEFCFKDLLELELHKFSEDVSEIVERSQKEQKIETKLTAIKQTWSKMGVDFDSTTVGPECPLLGDLGEVLEKLEGDSADMMNITSQGKCIEFCQGDVDLWSDRLRTIESTLDIWQKVQINWLRLEPIFLQSDDIKSQLPEDAKRFAELDTQFKDLMNEASNSTLIVDICCAEGRTKKLQEIDGSIDQCERSLNEYLEQKKKAFPRFYFCANAALLSILSNGNRPLKVAKYFGDIFDGMKTLNFSKAPDTGKIACGQLAKDGEKVEWGTDLALDGAVEGYLSSLEAHLRIELRNVTETARISADLWDSGERPREFWIDDFPSQISLVISQIMWTEETGRAFEEIEAGSENAMKDYKRICDDRINSLIGRVKAPLSNIPSREKELRVKIIIIITIDVHSRDVVEAFVVGKITDSSDFKWTQQLRFHWAMCPMDRPLVSYTTKEEKTCVIKICDWITIYCYEYIGNQGRLVITPLTDRCYITLTQAMNLTLGGAPAGPAGTGKTETTKDLSRALALQIVVFNCSDQMTYQTMAQIFMGIAATGCWGCFDEFNRISIEVLSVVSTHYKCILDGLRAQVTSFNFMDEECRLIGTCGAFITMNPGYAGRTELPENLKALFRSVAMIVPDLKFICENMLMSEGFVNARPLANKFVQLYSLCSQLLSKQMHYDWGLRAVKSLLRQAGGLLRKDTTAEENPVLCRALRDFNTPKITTNDMPIFIRLIRNLFPKDWPDPFQDKEFEEIVKKACKVRGLQQDPAFIIKVTSLLDILGVRHCCFIIGPTGCGKTESWKTLMETFKRETPDGKTVLLGKWEQANPKAVTSDELYGVMRKTEGWKDGLIAVIMRNMSNEENGYTADHEMKWVILMVILMPHGSSQ
jgi:dynein heavy chain